MENEPVMEITNQLMNDCDNFEIKNLDNNRGRVILQKPHKSNIIITKFFYLSC